MRVAIVRYNAGNVVSVANALNRLGVISEVTKDPESIATADKVIFPGVGEASSAMKYLKQHGIDEVISDLKQPVLAVCLGMQLLAEHSDENETDCLGIVPGRVKRFWGADLKVPHVGWNNISGLDSKLFEGISDGARVYFVHSFFLETCPQTIAETTYGVRFSAAVRKDNFYGVQFHPERSGEVGERIIKNFLSL